MTPRLRRYLLKSLYGLAAVVCVTVLLNFLFGGSIHQVVGIVGPWLFFVYVRWLFRRDPDKTT